MEAAHPQVDRPCQSPAQIRGDSLLRVVKVVGRLVVFV